MVFAKPNVRTIPKVCLVFLAIAVLLLSSILQTTSASTDVYVDWQVQNPGAGGHFSIKGYPQVIEAGQTYDVQVTVTLEWIEWGDQAQFQRIDWIFNDGTNASQVLGYSMANVNLTRDKPLQLSSHWLLQTTVLNATGTLALQTNITLIDSQSNSTRAADNFKLTAPVKISYKSASQLAVTVSPNNLAKGDTLKTNGSLTPATNRAPITLTYIKPNGDKLTRQVITNESGFFIDEYIPDTEGGWSVKADFSGNDNYTASTSTTATFFVNSASSWTRATAIAGLVLVIGIVAVMSYLSPTRHKLLPILPRDDDSKGEKAKEKPKRKLRFRLSFGSTPKTQTSS